MNRAEKEATLRLHGWAPGFTKAGHDGWGKGERSVVVFFAADQAHLCDDLPVSPDDTAQFSSAVIGKIYRIIGRIEWPRRNQK